MKPTTEIKRIKNNIKELAVGIEFNYFEYNLDDRRLTRTPYILLEFAAFSYKTITEETEDGYEYKNNSYEKNLDSLLKSKNLILNHYNFFSYAAKVCSGFNSVSAKRLIKIKNQSNCFSLKENLK